MKYDSISHRVTSSLLQLSLYLWNYVGRSWVFWQHQWKQTDMVLVYTPKLISKFFCQWATHGKHVSRWKYDCMVTSSVAHNLFIPNGPLNICFMFEVFKAFFYFYVLLSRTNHLNYKNIMKWYGFTNLSSISLNNQKCQFIFIIVLLARGKKRCLKKNTSLKYSSVINEALHAFWWLT